MASVSIIVQGPLHPISLGNIGAYQQFGETVLSFWANDNLSLAEPFHQVRKIANPALDVRPFSNPQNLYYQVVSTLAGLRAATGDFCIKVRSDEYYGNLAPVISQLHATPQKVVCDNIYFRKSWRMHMSDHLIAAERSLFIRCFELILQKLQTPGHIFAGVPPETLITSCFLQAMGVPVADPVTYRWIGTGHPDMRPNSPEEKSLLQNHFEMMPIRNLKPFIAKILLPSPNHAEKTHVFVSREFPELVSIGGHTSVLNSLAEL
ncbi:MAG: hypothetical protein ORN28_07775 [Rhodoferax sp.]|nr:hypothetical protein [Rhodoferax sp.]